MAIYVKGNAESYQNILDIIQTYDSVRTPKIIESLQTATNVPLKGCKLPSFLENTVAPLFNNNQTDIKVENDSQLNLGFAPKGYYPLATKRWSWVGESTSSKITVALAYEASAKELTVTAVGSASADYPIGTFTFTDVPPLIIIAMQANGGQGGSNGSSLQNSETFTTGSGGGGGAYFIAHLNLAKQPYFGVKCNLLAKLTALTYGSGSYAYTANIGADGTSFTRSATVPGGAGGILEKAEGDFDDFIIPYYTDLSVFNGKPGYDGGTSYIENDPQSLVSNQKVTDAVSGNYINKTYISTPLSNRGNYTVNTHGYAGFGGGSLFGYSGTINSDSTSSSKGYLGGGGLGFRRFRNSSGAATYNTSTSGGGPGVFLYW